MLGVTHGPSVNAKVLYNTFVQSRSISIWMEYLVVFIRKRLKSGISMRFYYSCLSIEHSRTNLVNREINEYNKRDRLIFTLIWFVLVCFWIYVYKLSKCLLILKFKSRVTCLNSINCILSQNIFNPTFYNCSILFYKKWVFNGVPNAQNTHLKNTLDILIFFIINTDGSSFIFFLQETYWYRLQSRERPTSYLILFWKAYL